MTKKLLVLISSFVLLFFFTSCEISKDDQSNSIPKSDKTRDLSIFIYDITSDVLSQSKSGINYNYIGGGFNTRSTSKVIVDGDLGGSAEIVASIINGNESGTISLNDFFTRQGFPTVETGNFEFNFDVTDNSIRGIITSSNFQINDSNFKIESVYNLYLENGLWRGTMKGIITINDDEFEIDYDYDTPILSSVEAVILDTDGNESTDKILTEGGTVRIKLGVNSNAPVNWTNLMWESPETNLSGGGSGCTFIEDSRGYWTYSRDYTISKYQPSGTYTWIHSVENASMLKSADKTVTIEAQNNSISTKPKITTATLSYSGLTSGDGSSVTLNITVESDSLVNWLSLSLEGPSKNIFGGGSGVTFTSLGNNLYSYQNTYNFTQWVENGVYTFTGLSVDNEADLSSEVYTDLSFAISGNSLAITPVITNIQAVSYSSDPLVDGVDINGSTLSYSGNSLGSILKLALIVTSTSNAPVNWSNETFNGPTVNLTGGGSGKNSNQVSSDTWRTIIPFFVSSPQYAPRGTYTWENISVENEGGVKSTDWEDSLYFELID